MRKLTLAGRAPAAQIDAGYWAPGWPGAGMRPGRRTAGKKQELTWLPRSQPWFAELVANEPEWGGGRRIAGGRRVTIAALIWRRCASCRWPAGRLWAAWAMPVGLLSIWAGLRLRASVAPCAWNASAGSQRCPLETRAQATLGIWSSLTRWPTTGHRPACR